MTTTQWITQFNETKDSFKWFIDKYFPGQFQQLELLAEKKLITPMLSLMNNIWFELPDHKFNIIVMPNGWREFLNLLEE